jgi:hypothetical protein
MLRVLPDILRTLALEFPAANLCPLSVAVEATIETETGIDTSNYPAARFP